MQVSVRHDNISCSSLDAMMYFTIVQNYGASLPIFSLQNLTIECCLYNNAYSSSPREFPLYNCIVLIFSEALARIFLAAMFTFRTDCRPIALLHAISLACNVATFWFVGRVSVLEF